MTESPRVRALMMTVNTNGEPLRSALVDLGDIGRMVEQGWVFVGLDPRDEEDLGVWLKGMELIREFRTKLKGF